MKTDLEFLYLKKKRKVWDVTYFCYHYYEWSDKIYKKDVWEILYKPTWSRIHIRENLKLKWSQFIKYNSMDISDEEAKEVFPEFFNN